MKRRGIAGALWALALLAAPAAAELPPPTPAELAEEQKKAEAQAAAQRRQAQALARAQERIAHRYRGLPVDVQAPVQKSDVPEAATQPPAEPPHTGRKPDTKAEAHSRPE